MGELQEIRVIFELPLFLRDKVGIEDTWRDREVCFGAKEITVAFRPIILPSITGEELTSLKISIFLKIAGKKKKGEKTRELASLGSSVIAVFNLKGKNHSCYQFI